MLHTLDALTTRKSSMLENAQINPIFNYPATCYYLSTLTVAVSHAILFRLFHMSVLYFHMSAQYFQLWKE